MGNFSDYAEEAFYANKALLAEAQASGLTREEIVAQAMKLWPVSLVYGNTEGQYGEDHGLAMAWWCLQGHRIPLGILVTSANISGDWSDVEACYGADRLDDVKAWNAAMEALLAQPRWAPFNSPERAALVAAHNKIKDLALRKG